jgi:hypothetical protein
MTDIADTRRLLELTSSDGGDKVDQRTDDAIDEIVSFMKRRAPWLLDGLEGECKRRIARSCQTRRYAVDDVVFRQDDPPDAYYTVIRGAVSIYARRTNDERRSLGRSRRFRHRGQ